LVELDSDIIAINFALSITATTADSLSFAQGLAVQYFSSVEFSFFVFCYFLHALRQRHSGSWSESACFYVSDENDGFVYACSYARNVQNYLPQASK